MRTYKGKVVADSITSGEVDIPAAGTAVQLISTATKCFKVIVSNINASNAIYVGDSNIDKTNSRSIKLNAGEHVVLDVADASMIYVDGTANGDDAGYIIFK